LQEIDFKSNREAKGSLIITEIAEAARNRLLSEEDTDDSIPILLIPIGDRVYEFQGEDESITLLWHETILSHFCIRFLCYFVDMRGCGSAYTAPPPNNGVLFTLNKLRTQHVSCLINSSLKITYTTPSA